MARTPKHTLRKLLYLDPEMADLIGEFRFSCRYKTEQEAIRELLRLGLAAWAHPQGTLGASREETPSKPAKTPKISKKARSPQLARKAAASLASSPVSDRFKVPVDLTYVSEAEEEERQAKEAEALAKRISGRS